MTKSVLDEWCEAVESAAEALQAELYEHYQADHGHPEQVHPSLRPKFNRDMDTVTKLRAALASMKAARERAVVGWAHHCEPAGLHNCRFTDGTHTVPMGGPFRHTPALLIPTEASDE